MAFDSDDVALEYDLARLQAHVDSSRAEQEAQQQELLTKYDALHVAYDNMVVAVTTKEDSAQERHGFSLAAYRFFTHGKDPVNGASGVSDAFKNMAIEKARQWKGLDAAERDKQRDSYWQTVCSNFAIYPLLAATHEKAIARDAAQNPTPPLP